MTKNSEKSNRPFIRNLAAYGAGAWAAIEVVDFLITRYSLASALLDVAIFLSVVGIAIVVVLTWFHGAQGRQRFGIAEIILLAVLAVIGSSGVYYISTQDPRTEFFEAEGFRLTLELKGGPQDGDDKFNFQAGFREGESFENSSGASFEGGFFLMAPKDFVLEAPDLEIKGQHWPVMFSDAINSDDEFARFRVILNSRPSDIDALLEIGVRHEVAIIETTNFSAKLNRPFRLTDQGESVVITLIEKTVDSAPPGQ